MPDENPKPQKRQPSKDPDPTRPIKKGKPDPPPNPTPSKRPGIFRRGR